MTDEEIENLRLGMAQVTDFHAKRPEMGAIPETIALSVKRVTWMLDEIESLRGALEERVNDD